MNISKINDVDLKSKLNVEGAQFAEWFTAWNSRIPEIRWSDVGTPESIAYVLVDAGVGFTDPLLAVDSRQANLASSDVSAIIPQVKKDVESAYAYGVRTFVELMDIHQPGATEFASYPPHMLEGTYQTALDPRLEGHPFDKIAPVFIPKNALAAQFTPEWITWRINNPQIKNFVFAVDLTDLCVQYNAMIVRLMANQVNDNMVNVYVPIASTETFDTNYEAATNMGLAFHPRILFGAYAYAHMALNGIHIVKSISQSQFFVLVLIKLNFREL